MGLGPFSDGQPSARLAANHQMSEYMKPVWRTESASGQLPEDLRSRAHLSHLTLRTALVAVLSICAGCQSGTREDGLLASATSWNPRNISAPWSRSSSSEAKALTEGRKFTAESRRESDQARQLFESGEYARAAKLYRQIARKYKGTSVGEQAQFRVGECRFAQRDYPAAQDAYDRLFADYPSTRYVESATRQMFSIAQEWLDVADPQHRGKIRTVSAEEVQIEPGEDAPLPSRDPTVRYRVLPNLHDSSRPLFDTQGRALRALKSIWLNDPTGPLADDAIMTTASYYLRRNDYVEADRYFQILREEYADSPHLRDAYLLGSHVRLMSYQGPYYDSSSLNGAQQLTAQSLNLFPDSSAREQLRRDLQKMYLLKAQRLWYRVPYYERKNNDRAVGVTCLQLITEYPDTKFADMARDRLARIDRSALAGLPGIEQQLDSLMQPPATPKSRDDKVKSVSDSSGGRLRQP